MTEMDVMPATGVYEYVETQPQNTSNFTHDIFQDLCKKYQTKWLQVET